MGSQAISNETAEVINRRKVGDDNSYKLRPLHFERHIMKCMQAKSPERPETNPDFF